jgi:hypothetical protein
MAPMVCVFLGGAGRLRGLALARVGQSSRGLGRTRGGLPTGIYGAADDRIDRYCAAARPHAVANLDGGSVLRRFGSRGHNICSRAPLSARRRRSPAHPQHSPISLLWSGKPASSRGVRQARAAAPSYGLHGDCRRMGLLWTAQPGPRLAMDHVVDVVASRRRKQSGSPQTIADPLRDELGGLGRDEYWRRSAADRNRRTVRKAFARPCAI